MSALNEALVAFLEAAEAEALELTELMQQGYDDESIEFERRLLAAVPAAHLRHEYCPQSPVTYHPPAGARTTLEAPAGTQLHSQLYVPTCEAPYRDGSVCGKPMMRQKSRKQGELRTCSDACRQRVRYHRQKAQPHAEGPATSREENQRESNNHHN
jgi:hypothetical protein